MKPRALLVDLDGTLCNVDHRRHHIEKSDKNWKRFFDLMHADSPVPAVVSVVERYRADHGIVLLTGRSEEYRPLTLEWLKRHGVGFHQLEMRAEGDFRPDEIIKQELYKKVIEPRWEIVFCLDDRNSVVQMWRKIGLTCFQVADGNF